MNITFCVDRFWPAKGGLEIYVKNIAQIFSKQGHRCKIVCFERHDSSFRDLVTESRQEDVPLSSVEDGVEIIVIGIPTKAKKHLQTLMVREGSYLDSAPDKYYLIRSWFMRSAAKALKFHIKPLLSDANIIHSMSAWEMSHLVAATPTAGTKIISGFLHKGFWADDQYSINLFSKYSGIIALSQTEKSDYKNLGINENKVIVAPIPSSQTSKVENQKFFSRANWPYVVFLGVKRGYKGIEALLETMPLIWNDIPDLRLILAGPSTPVFEKIRQAVALDSRIINLDFISENTKNLLLKDCLALCLPSSSEIMPNCIIEAWQHKKPVIVSDIPNLIEMVETCGICCSPDPQHIAKAITYLYRNPKIASTLGENGYLKAITLHSPESVSYKILAAYKHFLSQDTTQ